MLIMSREALRIQTFADPVFGENSLVLFVYPEGECWIVDPGFESQRLCEWITGKGLRPTLAINTHCHADHIAGNATVKEAFPEVILCAPADEAEVLVFGLFSRLRSDKGSVDILPRHVEMILAAIGSGKPVVVISFGSPYFYRHFPGVDAYLCAYRYAEEAQASAVRALFGEIDITGRLPVTIKGFYDYGWGLEIRGKRNP